MVADVVVAVATNQTIDTQTIEYATTHDAIIAAIGDTQLTHGIVRCH